MCIVLFYFLGEKFDGNNYQVMKNYGKYETYILNLFKKGMNEHV